MGWIKFIKEIIEKEKTKPNPKKEKGYILFYLKNGQTLPFNSLPLEETKSYYEQFIKVWKKNKYLKRKMIQIKCEDISAIAYYLDEVKE